jgi:hypothetical protein
MWWGLDQFVINYLIHFCLSRLLCDFIRGPWLELRLARFLPRRQLEAIVWWSFDCLSLSFLDFWGKYRRLDNFGFKYDWQLLLSLRKRNFMLSRLGSIIPCSNGNLSKFWHEHRAHALHNQRWRLWRFKVWVTKIDLARKISGWFIVVKQHSTLFYAGAHFGCDFTLTFDLDTSLWPFKI